jgi:hypothetical protein
LWNDALVVVLADHGVAFDRGHSTRAILGSEGSVLSIPMFVRYPGQRRGRVDGRNAELIDIAPTVADVADIDLPWQVDGSSLAGPDPKRRIKRVWAGFPLPPYDLDVTASKTEISERIRDLFGAARRHDDLFAFGPHRSLVGRRLSGLDLGDEKDGIAVTLDDPERWSSYRPDGGYVPARPSGELQGADPPPWMAIALNDTIAGLGRPFVEDGHRYFEIMVSDRYLQRGRNDLRFIGVGPHGELYEIDRAS